MHNLNAVHDVFVVKNQKKKKKDEKKVREIEERKTATNPKGSKIQSATFK
jgi:hypothetical protein